MTTSRSTKELFRTWRSGDAEAGQEMAQRFADWYYAISTSRLGESGGRGPCESACGKFGQGIVQVTESKALVTWAHKIIQDELALSGERAQDGDEPNAYTSNQKPKGLLAKAAKELQAEVELLEACYSGRTGDEELSRLAEPMGGMPIGVLKARYRVKQWLRDHTSVPFEVAPDQPILDRAPLPLYESGRMASADEEANFEQWMLSDIDLCKDIAEFAHFAIALRGGLKSTPSMKTVDARPTTRSDEAVDGGVQPTGSKSLAAVGIIAGVLALLAVLTVIVVAVLWFVL